MDTAFIVPTSPHGIVDGEETGDDGSDDETVATDEGDEFDFTAI